MKESTKRWREMNPGANAAATRSWEKRNPAQAMLNQYRKLARRRGDCCTITLEELQSLLVPMRCSVTGLQLSFDREPGVRYNPWVPSLDRLDNSAGYTPSNTRIVCSAYNLMRGTFSDETVLAVAKALTSTRD